MLDAVFRDRSGRVVIAQWPNIPIIGWALTKILAIFVGGRLHEAFGQLSIAFLFTWAFLEVTQGVNYFRRALGAVVIVAVSISFFR